MVFVFIFILLYIPRYPPCQPGLRLGPRLGTKLGKLANTEPSPAPFHLFVLTFIYLYVCGCRSVCVWPQKNCQSVLSFYHVGVVDQTQVIRFSSKHQYIPFTSSQHLERETKTWRDRFLLSSQAGLEFTLAQATSNLQSSFLSLLSSAGLHYRASHLTF